MISKISTIGMTHDEWMEERAKSIGGSEMASVLGMNPWQSAYALWCERTGILPAFQGNLATEVGVALEEFVSQKFAEKSLLGKNVMRSNFIYRNSEFPHLHASPDRLIHAGTSPASPVIGGLECKTTSSWNTKKFKGVDFPMQYYAQCVTYMAVLDVSTWYLAVLVGNSEYHIYKLRRPGEPDLIISEDTWLDGTIEVDDEDIAALKEAAEGFWHNLESGTAPVPDGSESSTEALKKTYPDSNGEEIELDGLEKEINELILLKAQGKDLDTRIAEIENILKERMGSAEKAKAGGHILTWKSQERTNIDTKKLKSELPEIAAKYSKTTTTRPFNIK